MTFNLHWISNDCFACEENQSFVSEVKPILENVKMEILVIPLCSYVSGKACINTLLS